MPCEDCGNILISEPNFKKWCANCSSEHTLYSKKETIEHIRNKYNSDRKEFFS